MSMDWDKLLCRERLYWPPDLPAQERPQDDDIIDVFQTDSSRITNSSAYHRLQRKTQVLPFPKTDYPRTRLTHTNEVSDCGRELARMVGRILAESGSLRGDQIASLEDVVSAACKAHDLGNPPFGHSGEYAIQDWARQNLFEGAQERYAEVSDEKRWEVLHFDGNGQGFRILTVTNGWRRKGGLQLSCAVLAAFCKYPWSSQSAKDENSKYSIPIDCMDIARSVFARTGMIEDIEELGQFKYRRHPLAFIVEAADDICYITSDLEDAALAEVGDEARVKDFLERIAKDAISDSYARSNFRRRQEQIAGDDGKALLRYLKDHAQRALKIAARDAFVANYDAIMSGEFGDELLKVSRVSGAVTDTKDYMRSDIYDNVGKVRHEVFGTRVVHSLMDFYAETLFRCQNQIRNGKTLRSSEDTIDEILRRQFITFPIDNYIRSRDYDDIGRRLSECSADELLQMAVDYVSGMTDPYAVSIYQQIFGIERPEATW